MSTAQYTGTKIKKFTKKYMTISSCVVHSALSAREPCDLERLRWPRWSLWTANSALRRGVLWCAVSLSPRSCPRCSRALCGRPLNDAEQESAAREKGSAHAVHRIPHRCLLSPLHRFHLSSRRFDAPMADMEDDPMRPAGGAPTNTKSGTRSVKRKSQKGTKAGGAAAGPKGAGAAAAASAPGAARKKKQKDEITFDPTDLHAPLPVNLRVWCKSHMTNRYHEAKVLDRRVKDDKFKIQSVPWPPSMNPPLPVVEGIQPDFSAHSHIYYIHYLEWDRRMDEWVFRDRICLATQVLALQPPSYNLASSAAASAAEKKEADKAAAAAAGKSKNADGGGDDDDEEKDEDTPMGGNNSKSKKKGKSKDGSKSKGKSGKGKGKSGGKDGGKSKSSDPAAAAAAASAAPIAGGDPHGGSLGGHGNFSQEDILAHEEATKVKNIESIVMGKYHMSTWYYSPFPSEYNQYNVLHCQTHTQTHTGRVCSGESPTVTAPFLAPFARSHLSLVCFFLACAFSLRILPQLFRLRRGAEASLSQVHSASSTGQRDLSIGRAQCACERVGGGRRTREDIRTEPGLHRKAVPRSQNVGVRLVRPRQHSLSSAERRAMGSN